MRKWVPLLGMLLLLPWNGAEAVEAPPASPSCAVVPQGPGCGRPDCPYCGCQPVPRPGPPYQEEIPREGPPAEESYPRETGFYQAPPRTGGFQAPTRSFGFSLGGVVLPEIRLRLPSIELPSCYRVHQGARMRIDAAEAPWVSTGFETAAPGLRGGPVQAPEQPRRGPDDSCQTQRREYEQKLDELQRKIDECEQLKRSIQDSLERQRDACPVPSRQRGGPTPVQAPKPIPDNSWREPPGTVQPASFGHVVRLPPVRE